MSSVAPEHRARPGLNSAQIAKATLRRLAVGQVEPTPENYARDWVQESGQGAAVAPAVIPAITAQQWAGLIERPVRGIERGRRQ